VVNRQTSSSSGRMERAKAGGGKRDKGALGKAERCDLLALSATVGELLHFWRPLLTFAGRPAIEGPVVVEPDFSFPTCVCACERAPISNH
jgi:hypothetical protein